jgi:hypothetical protein
MWIVESTVHIVSTNYGATPENTKIQNCIKTGTGTYIYFKLTNVKVRKKKERKNVYLFSSEHTTRSYIPYARTMKLGSVT